MTNLSRIKQFLAAFTSLAVLWWILVEGSTSQFWFGLVVAFIATASAWRTILFRRSISRLRFRAWVRFVPYFIAHSFKGGLGVALFALKPGVRVRPAYIRFTFRIPARRLSVRISFATLLCLFPGSLSCILKGDQLLIHVLDPSLFSLEDARELEEYTAALFGMDLPPSV